MKTKFLKLDESDIQSLALLNSVHRNFKYTPVRPRNIDGIYYKHELSLKGNTTDSFFRFFSQSPVVDIEDPIIEKVYSANEPAVDDPIWFNHLPCVFSESAPPPKMLYHYTSASGLLGILPKIRSGLHIFHSWMTRVNSTTARPWSRAWLRNTQRRILNLLF